MKNKMVVHNLSDIRGYCLTKDQGIELFHDIVNNPIKNGINQKTGGFIVLRRVTFREHKGMYAIYWRTSRPAKASIRCLNVKTIFNRQDTKLKNSIKYKKRSITLAKKNLNKLEDELKWLELKVGKNIKKNL